MKCPKCGFNSFEYLNSCKKCGNAMDAFKNSLGLRPLVLAQVLADNTPDLKPSLELQPDQIPSGTEAAEETFKWDLPAVATTGKPAETGYEEFSFNLDEAEPTPPSPTFSFDEEPTSPPDIPAVQSADDSIFGDFSFDDSPSEIDPFATNITDKDNPFGEEEKTSTTGAQLAYNELEALFGELEPSDKKK